MAPAEEKKDEAVEPESPSRGAPGHGRAWWWSGLLAGPVAVALSLIAGTMPELTERVYGQLIGPAAGWALARSTGWIPISLAEWALALAALHWIGRWATALRLDGARWSGLARATAQNLREWSIVLAVFTLIFGMQYRRPPLVERMDWGQEIPDGLLAELATTSVAEVNALYLALHGREDAGAPTSADDFAAVDRALEAAWPAVVREFRLGRPAAWTRGRSKELLISPLLARLGLSGFYFPWTGEANLNRDVPAVRQPHVMAHEKAHQRGIAREDEASFLGWAAAARSDSQLARYSAAVYAHRRLLVALMREDPGRGLEVLRSRYAGVQRDVDDLQAYWGRHQGRATEIAGQMNDRYLRSHHIPDGRASYGRSLVLFLLYASNADPTAR